MRRSTVAQALAVAGVCLIGCVSDSSDGVGAAPVADHPKVTSQPQPDVAVQSPPASHLPREGNVRFKAVCRFDHAANDDPIVYPGKNGAAHRHNFFGKVNVQENSDTYQELVNTSTTCDDSQDFAAYWTPGVRTASGSWITPGAMSSYYRRGEKRGDIEPFPDGLKIVAGYPQMLDPDGEKISGWRCGPAPATTNPASSCTKGYKMSIAFPDCWDGTNLDSADHRSHMAYSAWSNQAESKVCPATHPVQVPALTNYVNFSGSTGSKFASLSSGDHSTLHGDFFNGWATARQAERVETCLNQLQRCLSGD